MYNFIFQSYFLTGVFFRVSPNLHHFASWNLGEEDYYESWEIGQLLGGN
jgi:hypothetical protein